MARFYLKLFVAAFSMGFAGAAGINLFEMAPAAAFLGALYPAGLFGVFMTLAWGPFHVLMSKRIAGGGCGPEIYRTRQSAELSIGIGYEKLFSLAHRYLKEIAGFEILEADIRARRITARSSLSLKTFGNIITFEFPEGGPTLANLRISSRPRLITTLMDYGENLKIVLDAKNYIMGNSG